MGFSMMFRHFDKDRLGRLDHNQFKSCLRALGYDLPMVEEGAPEPEFQAILDDVDPNRDGHVSLQDYMAFKISKALKKLKMLSEPLPRNVNMLLGKNCMTISP